VPRSTADIDAELTLWYAARTAAANRLGATSVTIAGRSFAVNLKDINDTIRGLESERRAAAGGMFSRTRISGVGESL
jgi:hypothetical protein